MHSTIILTGLLAAMAQAMPSYFDSRATCSKVTNVIHTFYGYPDNSPPGAGIAYDCGRGYTAGGTGSQSDPLTFATAPGEFNKCEIIYDPYLKKYLRFEDTCAQCGTDWNSKKWHIDVWTGSATQNGGQDQINCEDALTPDNQSIVRNPASNLPVDTTQLYQKGANPSCKTSHTYPNYNINDYCS